MATILVVDDHASSRRMLTRLLESHGYAVLSAGNAFEAMGAVHQGRPDLMLLDVMIPPVDGLTLLMLLREETASRELPVILVTGLSDDLTVQRAKDLGVRGHLIKADYKPEQLLDLVKKNLPPENKVSDNTGASTAKV